MRRLEDERLLRGGGGYVSDLLPEGCLHAAFVRSPLPCATIRSVDAAAARELPGVAAVFTAADLGRLGQAAVNPLVPGLTTRPFSPLAEGRVGAVGEAVALVVAESAQAALDAAEAVEVDYEELPPETPETLFRQSWRSGEPDAAFAAADAVVEVRGEHARLAPSPMEPRAALAEWDGRRLTVWLSTQTPHRARADLAAILGLDPERIDVIAPDVGGAFGGKASLYPEDAAVALAARTLGRPVRWCATRGEDLLAATHGRGGVLDAALAVDRNGTFLALRAEIAFPLGQWMPYSAVVPARNAARVLPGPYRGGAVDITMRGETSNTATLGIYRGAGRPEAAMVMERLVESAARRLGVDPLELRRRNSLPTIDRPYRTPTGEVVDSADAPGLLEAAQAAAGYDGLRQRRDERRAAGEICGLGTALYIEPCGAGWESARVGLAQDGRIVVATGSTNQGQGRASATAQLVGDILRVPPEGIVVHDGDTRTTPAGIGALASRSTAIGGSALLLAAGRLHERARTLAGELLQADPADLEACETGFRLANGLVREIGWPALAEAARCRQAKPAELVLVEDERFETPAETWASGCCIAFVSIEADTGIPTIERLLWVDDAGRVVNPLLAEGQLVGGAVQGLGEALMERIVYDESGQLSTGSLMDYALPRAADVPPITLVSRDTPSPSNPLGAKGVGEAGCVAVPPAIVNAVVDALAPFGVDHLDMPLTSEKIWRALRRGGKGEA